MTNNVTVEYIEVEGYGVDDNDTCGDGDNAGMWYGANEYKTIVEIGCKCHFNKTYIRVEMS